MRGALGIAAIALASAVAARAQTAPAPEDPAVPDTPEAAALARETGDRLNAICYSLRRETASNTFNVFNLHHVQAARQGTDYVLELRPLEGSPLTNNMAYDRIYLRVGEDLLVRRLQGKMQDGSDLAIDFRHGLVVNVPVVTGFRSQTTQATGETTIIDRSHTFALVEGVPLLTEAIVDQQIATMFAQVTMRTACRFENWRVTKRAAAIPNPGTEEYRELFRHLPEQDRPLIEVEGEGAPPGGVPGGTPAAPPGGMPGATPGGTPGGTPHATPGGTGGGLFEDEPPPARPGGGLFEDEPGAGGDADEAARRLGEEMAKGIAAGYYGWHRFPGRTYRARLAVGDDPARPAVLMDATPERLDTAQIADPARYDLQAVMTGLFYGWYLAMTGPLVRTDGAAVTWSAVRAGDGGTLTGRDAEGRTVEEVRLGAGLTILGRVLTLKGQGGEPPTRLSLTFETQEAAGTKYLRRVVMRQETEAGLVLGERSFTYTYQHLAGTPFLKRVVVETTKDGRALAVPFHVTEADLGD